MSTLILSHARFLPSLVAVAALLGSPAFAASACKGISENACSAAEQCIWVKGYTRKDGRAVSSHCKLSSRKKLDQSAESGARKLSAVAR